MPIFYFYVKIYPLSTRNFTSCSFILLLLLLVSGSLYADDKQKEYITTHLNTTVYAIDSEASAVVLLESRKVEISEEHVSYMQRETIHKIIKVLKNDAIAPGRNNVADIHIRYKTDNILGSVSQVKARTYNMGPAGMTEQEMPAADIKKKKITDEVYEVSFSLPAVREGSVIEYSFVVTSKFNGWHYCWEIQDDRPKLVSEFEFEYPDRFQFTSINSLRNKYVEFPTKDDARLSNDKLCRVYTKFVLSETYHNVFWRYRDATVIKEEPMVRNIDNMKERVELQLTGVRTQDGIKHFNNSWENTNEQFWKKEKLGKAVMGSNNFLDDVMDTLVKDDMTNADKVRKIYNYIRSGFDREDAVGFSRSPYETFSKKRGNPFEINLLLCAMMAHEGIDVGPVMISTTHNISFTEIFPVIDRFNYLVATVLVDGQRYYLDASDKSYRFGLLPSFCYNGFAWVLSEKGWGVQLEPGMVTDRTVCAVKIDSVTATSANLEMTMRFGALRSQQLRQRWAKDRSTKDAFIKEMIGGMPSGCSLVKQDVGNEDQPDTNLVMTLKGRVALEDAEDLWLIKGELFPAFTTHPFTARKRSLPIEFPSVRQYVYHMNVILPDGMEPETIPAPVDAGYEDKAVAYKRSVTYYPEMHSLTVNSVYEQNATVFEKEEYGQLSQFFRKMIEENNNMITIKRTGKK